MSDKEIIKALRCCADKGCKFCSEQGKLHCRETVASLAWDLIYRQKAEIERVREEKELIVRTYKDCQIDNLKEFIKKFKKKIGSMRCTPAQAWEIMKALDAALTEMTEKGGAE